MAIWLAAAAVLVAGPALADEKKDAKFDAAKLVGKWEMVKSDEQTAPKGALVEFTKDGKVTLTLDAGGKKFEMGGTYKLAGDKLTVKFKPPDGGEEKEDTDTVKSLTDDKLVLVDKQGKTTEMAKKK
jgi:uncharacterized protein (TIGR03066 family)